MLYRRYIDNLLIFRKPDFERIRESLDRLKSKSSPCTGEVEEASSICATFLDVNLRFGMKYRQISWLPNTKPSALTSALSIHSAHPIAVHVA